MASGRINNVVIRDAAQHGLGIYNVPGWIQNSQVVAASTETNDTWSACNVVSASIGARVEDCLFDTTNCDHGLAVTGNLRIGGIDMIGTDAVNGHYSVPTTTVWSRAYAAPFSGSGVLLVGTGTFKFPVLYSSRIIGCRSAVGVAPVGTSLLVDVNKNGTTIFTTQGNRPSIATTEVVSTLATPDVQNLEPGDYLTVDIDQIGSTTAGEDLTVVVLLENDDS